MTDRVSISTEFNVWTPNWVANQGQAAEWLKTRYEKFWCGLGYEVVDIVEEDVTRAKTIRLLWILEK